MRSMSLLQMAGGVAMAGAVAAGTTAFTANAGVTNGITGQKSFLGGVGTHTIVGAELTTFAWGTTDTSVTPTRVSSFTLTFNADTPTGAAVTVTQGGTPGGVTGTAGTTPDNFYCSTVSAGKASTCTVGLSLADPGGYITGITNLSIRVV